VDGDRLLLAGHSEGALLAAAVAARGAAVRGAVLLSPSATTGEHLLRWQAAQIAPSLPRPVRLLLRLLRTDIAARSEDNRRRIAATTTDAARIGGVRLNGRWTREFMAHDPRDDLRTVADLAPGPVETHRLPDATHTLRRQPGPPSLSRYRRELREPVDAEVLASVTGWCLRAVGDPPLG
jgi:uncharacterized protein